MTTTQYNKKRDSILNKKLSDQQKNTLRFNLWIDYVNKSVENNRLTNKN